MSSAVRTRAAVFRPAGHVTERTIVETARMNPKRNAVRQPSFSLFILFIDFKMLIPHGSMYK